MTSDGENCHTWKGHGIPKVMWAADRHTLAQVDGDGQVHGRVFGIGLGALRGPHRRSRTIPAERPDAA